jgi:ribonuclease HI
MFPEVNPVLIYTDGACTGNPGPGGYGVIVKQHNGSQEYAQGYRLTTNNRMELMAAIVGLGSLKQRSHVKLYTDSKYVADAINLGWVDAWRARGWRKADKSKVLNPDLWQQFVHLLEQHKVEMIWVKGHAGHPENERCDKLAVDAAHGKNLMVDTGYEQSREVPKSQPGLF